MDDCLSSNSGGRTVIYNIKLTVPLCVCVFVCMYPFFSTRKSECDQIWHTYVDRSGKGSNLNKMSTRQSGKCYELPRKSIHVLTTTLTVGGASVSIFHKILYCDAS